MIMSPCSKCLVKPVCEDPCPQIKRRKRFFDQLETYLMGSGVMSFFGIFTLLMFKDTYPGIISLGGLLMIGMMSIFILEIIYIRTVINKSTRKFPELERTTRPPPGFPPPRSMKPPPPPPPPLKRYLGPSKTQPTITEQLEKLE